MIKRLDVWETTGVYFCRSVFGHISETMERHERHNCFCPYLQGKNPALGPAPTFTADMDEVAMTVISLYWTSDQMSTALSGDDDDIS